ncbi:MAG: glycogen/starch/alpha-glucan phosphorylase [Erysipelotrichaceae bacterium]|nr:glycogen/starch/alpha-glucan phosphorylase [Erysipelotrichaceae bacterium]
MFTNKQIFIQEYTRRMAEKYGRSVESSHPTERFLLLGEMVRDYASTNWKQTKEMVAKHQSRQMMYFSMEFLIGRLLTNNMMNLGIYDIVKDGLADMNIDLNEIEDLESDAGLGNGGLGRLAACFLDSLAALELPGSGNCIRYQYGLFKQKIVNGRQVEVPDMWLRYGNPWEIRKAKHAVDVKFFGRIEMTRKEDGHMQVRHVDAETVRAVPYDMPIVGHGTKVTNSLRLWNAEAAEDLEGKDFKKYISEVNEICQNVYPDDSTEHGKILRLKQEYFFVSAGVQSIIKAHLRVYPNLDNFHEKYCFQMNDTHPILVIPEMMRILMDEYNYGWDEAWNIVTKTVAYTNHTVMSEALEKWSVAYVQKLLPRIYMIIEEINTRFVREINEKFHDYNLANRVAVIRDGQVHMAHLGIVAAYSVNGVAALHTEILKNDVMKDFYHIYPEKFNNKTNGVTHRRWLVYSNPQLRELLNETIGDSYIKNPADLEKLIPHVHDKELQEKFFNVKKQRKEILAAYIKKVTGVEIDTNSIFDVQAKRLHAYKRQLLNVLHIIYLYQEIKRNPEFTMHPRTFIFAAKAAPAYTLAKSIIELIHAVGEKVNNDPEVSRFMKVVFIPNYSVSIAEILMNASDVSEQISTAGKEASGTGNMKFMINGAITLGTYDGANVEIHGLVGDEHSVIFGLRVEDIEKLRAEGYNAWKYYNEDRRIMYVLNSLIDGTWSKDPMTFKLIYDELLYRNDEYFLLADFDAYVKAQRKIEAKYRNREEWLSSCLYNIGKAGFFSTDRTIQNYSDDIWHLEKVYFD